jgi:hypothetical protein
MFISDRHFTASISGEDGVEFPFDRITGITMQEYDAVRDFGGWGERYGSKKRGTEHTRTFTVSGNKAVVVELRSGEKLFIGTGDPKKLSQALQSAMERKI